MRTNTESYLKYKKEIKDIWNFVVMVCYAVPSLNKTIKGVEQGVDNYKLPKADDFKHDKSSLEILKSYSKPSYKKRLASYLHISSFSFFEAYVKGAIEEFIHFHGDADVFVQRATHRTEKHLKDNENETKKHRSKLHGPYKKSNISRYAKHIKQLEELHYRFPTELFSAYGLKALIARSKDLTAKDIPEIMMDCFSFPLDREAIRRFISYKDRRNNIAHGNPSDYTLKEVLDMNEDLKSLAYSFDQHLINYYFILEKERIVCNSKGE